ncbi:MAG TPA: potassium/proton antiporter [Geminicoccaceae bacterium]
MDLANQLILLAAFLLLLSIFVGVVASRIGAPLLLAFLALGMFFGEDGPGRIYFDNYQAAYLIGSAALAIILFDGGLRTDLGSFKLAAWPALVLATVGVVITTCLTGLAAHWLLDLDLVESFLIGAVVGSTDAAAVFFLLHLHGLDIKRRVRSVLEVESGLNDPMAVFLTIGCVELLLVPVEAPSWFLLADFARQIVGGALIGIAAGFVLVWLISRIELAAGLYPVLAMAFALFIYAAAQAVGASGFLAVYLVGLIAGNRRHRATQLVNRFHDGLAWLSQMVMFVMLGLLVTPSDLLPTLVPAVLIAIFLVVVARPVAVAVCLLPFRFSWNEVAFVAWVGLRGAVAIFLGTIPVLVGAENASTYFEIAFVVVLISLVVQGWTIARAARALDLELPPPPKPPRRIDIDLPVSGARDLMIYTVDPGSRVSIRGVRRLLHLENTSVLGVMRDGRLLRTRELDRLEPGDSVLLIAPPEQAAAMDQLFGSGPKQAPDAGIFGEFSFEGDVALGEVAAFYGATVPDEDRDRPISEFVRQRLGRKPVVGDRLAWGEVEFVIQEMAGESITRVGIELEPEERRRWSWSAARRRLKDLRPRWLRRERTAPASDVPPAAP